MGQALSGVLFTRCFRIPGLPAVTIQPFRIHQANSVSFNDLSPPFIRGKSVNFIFKITLVHLQASGIKAVSLLSGSYRDQSLAPCYTAFLRWVVFILNFSNYLLVCLQVSVSTKSPYRSFSLDSILHQQVSSWLLIIQSSLGIYYSGFKDLALEAYTYLDSVFCLGNVANLYVVCSSLPTCFWSPDLKAININRHQIALLVFWLYCGLLCSFLHT